MIEEYNKINNPNDLLEFISNNIKYGFLGKNGKSYYHDDDFKNSFFDEYVLEDKDDILNTLYGNCWDQVELERDWFSTHNYEFKTIFEMVSVEYKNDYPTHTFLAYREGDYWYWFEHSDNKHKGIYKFNSFGELMKFEKSKYIETLNDYNITEEELGRIIFREYQKPNKSINVDEYLDFVLNSKEINFT